MIVIAVHIFWSHRQKGIVTKNEISKLCQKKLFPIYKFSFMYFFKRSRGHQSVFANELNRPGEMCPACTLLIPINITYSPYGCDSILVIPFYWFFLLNFEIQWTGIFGSTKKLVFVECVPYFVKSKGVFFVSDFIAN